MRGFAHTRWIYRLHLALLLPELIVFPYLVVDLALNPSLAEQTVAPGQLSQLVAGLLIAPLTVGVGLFCIRRAPGNVVGAILAVWGCGIVQIVSTRSSPWIDAYNTTFSGIIWPAAFYLFSYFPDGRVYPRRFEKWVDGMVLFTYTMSFLWGLSAEFTFLSNSPNLLFVPHLKPFSPLFQIGDGAGAIFGLLFGMVSLTLRYRAAEPGVRQQMKWLLWGLLPFVVLVIPQVILLLLQLPSWAHLTDLLGGLLAFWLMLFPVISTGNAILRHRLYDIDLIIRRTLIYGALTGLLAGVYFGGVALAQALLRPFTGAGDDLAVVVTTLGIAALALPLRRAVQRFIDRRFYRGKYDAARALATFSNHVRDEVELEALTGRLLSVVNETMQPAQVSLWLIGNSAANATAAGRER